jgi:hypothetical protein
MKKILLWGFVGVVVLLILIVAFAPAEQPVSKVNSDSPKQEQKQEPKKQVYKVGDTVKISDTEVTITSATIGNPDEYTETKNGKVLTLEIKGENKGTQSWFLSNTDFNLYDSQGNKMQEYFGGMSYVPLSGEVNQDKKISGQIKYDAKPGTYDLVYKPNFLLDQEIHWTIEVK